MSDSSEEKESNVSKEASKEAQEEMRSDEKVQEEVSKPKLPYPQKFLRNKIDEQFGTFLDMLKEVRLSIPLTNAMTQMPRYCKFFKEIFSGKRECNEIDSVEVGECYIALISNDLPKKMKDPGSFSIPCKINGKLFQNALCDLGASVSIMPYSVFRKLKLGELHPTNTTLQLAELSIKFLKGRVEDVPSPQDRRVHHSG
ncbi:uncharacterized protein LOC110705299 [Chenopodium quinoa]|uniref:uncharacterized protein LOC110705299 n=1 Tax=Chenopodium quinoa TaxID=63459 RepID=UPI000B77CFE1|nr:uncharacterized protein LOC110705299 [Chenopodium quinoa]